MFNSLLSAPKPPWNGLGKYARAVVCSLLAVVGVAAPSTSAQAKVNLVVWGLDSGEDYKGRDHSIDVFEQQNPDIHVFHLSMGAGSMNPQKLMTAIVGGAPPDLVLQDRFSVGDWASRGTFMPLDDLVANDEKSSDPNAVHKKDYLPAAWNEAVYNNHVYAIPWGLDIRALYYNKNDFRDAGLDPNKPPQTWDEMMFDAKKITQHTPAGYSRIGFIPAFSQGWLYIWSWQEDGEFMSADGKTCTLDNPYTEDALKHEVQWYDELGGVDAINTFAGGFAGDEDDPFMTGRLAMKVDGDWVLASIARYHPELDFGICPVPVPAERFNHEGRYKQDPQTWVTWAGGYAFVIPKGAKHVKEAWRFIQWENSVQGNLCSSDFQRDYVQSKGRLFVPRTTPIYPVNQAFLQRYVPSLPPNLQSAVNGFQQLLPFTKYRPVTFVGQTLWDEHARAVDRAIRHEASPHNALADGQQRVQIELNRVYTVNSHPVLPMGPVVGGILAFIAALLVAAIVYLIRWSGKHRKATRQEAAAGYGFAIPWMIGFLMFTAGPIIASFVLSFCDYDVLHPARWAGIENYRNLVTLDRDYLSKAIFNVFYLGIIGVPLGMMTSLAMAMLLDTKIRGLNYYRTILYLPSIIPAVATAVLWAWLLNSDPQRGLLNMIWQGTFTHWFGWGLPGWLAVPGWAKPALITVGVWSSGGGIILWLAGLKSVPPSLYEAASLDGAGPFAQFKNVTLPMLSPYIFFNVIMGTIGALQTFELSYIMGHTDAAQGTGPDNSLLVPVVYLFNNAFQYFKMGYASALAWLLFIVILGLTLGQLKLAPRWVHYETD